ncbi:protein BEAN1 [Gadus morhua]|uniref:protein BEAN1 n=1 Tax=Gadus morhua TaxID=8049 RepID=UPI0011B4A47F|nr:protein BEAN1 [Gadus morhua]XP_030235365.1 protein BEAN1 [Gadus morhua]XP_030235366.1 protein BEAN1 [Gadus morhua]XP_030235367.1 protein BEAN1 [Gadus morhua]XP_030235368.1 protein BEAN1 [Gadus morhua]XP_030235369.1 protein BEAN1 [Gadus morhua]XP_030235370.1 protein BEAN1 [Gadus morhua]XP_030235371.1 protein BEAN1 [Gadus morhua]
MVSQVSLNHSNGELENCWFEPEDASLLVSPLVVAGIVIGLVLFLSCVTIIIGSLRKDSRLQTPHLRASYGPDGFSYEGSLGELRSACMEDFPPGLDFNSYTETLSDTHGVFQDSPPGYDECISPGASQLFIPTEDPPPYSLLDPLIRGAGQEEEPAFISPYPYTRESSASWLSPDQYPIGLQDPEQQPISSISLPLEAAPAYDSVVTELPLMPCVLYKHQSQGAGAQPHHTEADHVV